MKLESQIIDFFENNFSKQIENEPEFVKNVRFNSFRKFKNKGFPNLKDEKWRKTKLTNFTGQYYHPVIHGMFEVYNDLNTCIVPEIKTHNVSIVNGHYTGKTGFEILSNGMIVGSIKVAFVQFPDIVKKYFNRLINKSDNPIDDLNTFLFSDGLFVFVPKNTQNINLQINHRLDGKVDALINTRNLIILEENSKLNIIQCDDSNEHRSHFATFHTEIFVDKKAELNWYKYQNINNVTALFSNHFAEVNDKGRLFTNFYQLNGRLLRNEQFTDIAGKDVEIDHFGLYLTDKVQQFDNVIFVSHSSEGSYSNQKFKGILDDSAKGFFNGQILVKKDAQQTNAYQKNDTILLTDKAKMSSQPFLEIYADDVSCSHGSTTGQIDEDALFYIRQRGISKRDAQLLQLYAFVGEIIDAIKIPELIEPTKDLIKKRLNGELDVCEDCILQCATKR